MPVSQAFTKSLNASKQLVKRWQEAKKAEPSTGYIPDVKSGQYFARIRIEADQTEKGTPRVRIRPTIVSGEYTGKGWYADFYLKDEDETKEQQTWDRLSKAIQVLADIDGEDFDTMELPELCELLGTLDEEAPFVKIGVQRKEDKAKGKTYLNTYFNQLIEEADLPADAEVDAGAGDSNGSGNGEQTEGGEGEDMTLEELGEAADEGNEEAIEELTAAAKEADLDPDDYDTWALLVEALPEEETEEKTETGEDTGEDVEIAKGDYVWYRIKGKRSDTECEVISSNKTKRTCSLKEHEGVWEGAGISWDDVEPVIEAEE